MARRAAGTKRNNKAKSDAIKAAKKKARESAATKGGKGSK